MNRGYSGGKRQREADRDRRKKEKNDRLRQNRQQRAQGIEPSGDAMDPQMMTDQPEVKLEDIIVSGVAPRTGGRRSMGPTKLFVGGLRWETTKEDLAEAFNKFGPVVEAIIVNDRNTGRSRGFGFVTFENPEHAALASKQMDGADFDGRILKVNPAEGR